MPRQFCRQPLIKRCHQWKQYFRQETPLADVADSESGDSHSSDVTLVEGGLASGRRLAADLAAGLGLPFIAGFWVTMKTT